MSRLPICRARDVIRALVGLGFVRVRQHGSHILLHHPITNQTTVVPMHAGEDIDRGLLRQILREIHVDPDTFIRALRER